MRFFDRAPCAVWSWVRKQQTAGKGETAFALLWKIEFGYHTSLGKVKTLLPFICWSFIYGYLWQKWSPLRVGLHTMNVGSTFFQSGIFFTNTWVTHIKLTLESGKWECWFGKNSQKWTDLAILFQIFLQISYLPYFNKYWSIFIFSSKIWLYFMLDNKCMRRLYDGSY